MDGRSCSGVRCRCLFLSLVAVLWVLVTYQSLRNLERLVIIFYVNLSNGLGMKL